MFFAVEPVSIIRTLLVHADAVGARTAARQRRVGGCSPDIMGDAVVGRREEEMLVPYTQRGVASRHWGS